MSSKNDKGGQGGKGRAIGLIGSNKYSAEIPLAEGRVILLGDLVEAAQKASGLSLQDWNALDEQVRDGHIEQALEAARAVTPEPQGTQEKQDTKGGRVRKVAGLRITARQAGFRRAGHAWPATATDVPASSLTRAQIAALREEPMLVVEDIEIEA